MLEKKTYTCQYCEKVYKIKSYYKKHVAESRVFDNDNQIFEIKCRKIHGCSEDKTIINIFEI